MCLDGASGILVDDVCVCDAADSQPCETDLDCAEACIQERCAPLSSTNGTCDETADCQAGHTCSAGVCVLDNGESCTANAQCLQVCITGTCGDASGTSGACDETPDCQAGHTCSAGVCVLDNGESCTANAQCLHACINGTCAPQSGVGGDCDENADCSAGLSCAGGTCASGCGPYWGGSACDVSVVYVDDDIAAGTGESWALAYNNLNDALAQATTLLGSRPPPVEVWVAAGSYTPFASSATDTFQLVANVHVYGGFAGSEANRSERSWQANSATLDGSNSVYHVVTGASDAVLDGFVVQNGWAQGAEPYGGGMYNTGGISNVTVANVLFQDNQAAGKGGGIYCDNANITVSSAVFNRNSATDNGGGMHVQLSTSVQINDTMFFDNSADWSGAIQITDATVDFNGTYFISNQSISGGGGAIEIWSGANVTLTDCVFTDNESGLYGGGIAFDTIGSARLRRCHFTSNRASNRGGAIHNLTDSLPAIENTTFMANSCGDFGGAIYGFSGCHVAMAGCTFLDNVAGTSGGALHQSQDSDGSITNSILWNNTPDPIYTANNTCQPAVSYTLIQGGQASGCAGSASCTWSGTILDQDPGFLAVPLPETGTWEDLSVDATSFESTLTDLDGNWPVDSLVGMFVRPDVSADDDVRYLIESNTTTTLVVKGDLRLRFSGTESYRIYSYALPYTSVCVDQGTTTAGLTDDVMGNPRVNKDSGAPGDPDIGAYEYQP